MLLGNDRGSSKQYYKLNRMLSNRNFKEIYYFDYDEYMRRYGMARSCFLAMPSLISAQIYRRIDVCCLYVSICVLNLLFKIMKLY